MATITELEVDDAWDAERNAHNCARAGTMTHRSAQLFTTRAMALHRAFMAQQDGQQSMAMLVAQKWIAAGSDGCGVVGAPAQV